MVLAFNHTFIFVRNLRVYMNLVIIDLMVLNMLDMLLLSRNLFYRGENKKLPWLQPTIQVFIR